MSSQIDWSEKRRHFLITVAFCVIVALVLNAVQDKSTLPVSLAYSECIGICTWAFIEFGRHLIPSSSDSGWPTDWKGYALVGAGSVFGFLVGISLADYMFGWNTFDNKLVNWRTSVLVSAVASLIASYFFYTRIQAKWLEEQRIRAERQANESRLKLLETQLEPHMLFNTLANLRALIGSNPQAALDMLDHLDSYLRATLEASRAPTHSLKAEFDRLRDYLELMRVRMGKRLSYHLDLPPELASHHIPSLILQSLVENSIRHGLEPKLEGGSIQIFAKKDGMFIRVEVVDDGLGLEPSVNIALQTASEGFGLAQVRERLATQYAGRAQFELQNSTQSDSPTDSHCGVRAIVCIPV